MFRRLDSSVPKDFYFPADLHGLGYFVNDNDQIRMVRNPEQPFHYHISKNDRCVEMQKEAMATCIRKEVMQRLQHLNLETVPVPRDALDTEPHVPILATKNLDTCSRVIVFVGESLQDLGILAGRIISIDSINKGSAVDWVKYETKKDSDQPGIVLCNPGQLIWWRKNRSAVSHQSWNAIGRKSAVAPGLRLGDKNEIPRNKTSLDHVGCVFEDYVAPMVKRGCKVDVIGVEDGATTAVTYLEAKWDTYKNGMRSMVILTAYVWTMEWLDEAFKDWFGKRARAYIISAEPFGTPLRGRDSMGCNVYSADENFHVECIFPRRYKPLLDYFKLVGRNPDYINIPQDIPPPEPVAGEWGDDGVDWNSPAKQDAEVIAVGDNVYGIADDGLGAGDAVNAEHEGEVQEAMEKM